MADLERDVRHWRALALAGAAACGLMVARIRISPQVPLWRLLHPEFWSRERGDLLRRHAARLGEPGQPVDEDDLFSETPAQGYMRRLRAIEAHMVDLEERFGPVANWWYGDKPCGQRR